MTLNPELTKNNTPVLNYSQNEEILEVNEQVEFSIIIEANNP